MVVGVVSSASPNVKKCFKQQKNANFVDHVKLCLVLEQMGSLSHNLCTPNETIARHVCSSFELSIERKPASFGQLLG